MKQQYISLHQLLSLTMLALLSLGVELAALLMRAGSALWLVPLLAFLPVMLILLLALRGKKQLAARDLVSEMPRALGKAGGGMALVLFALWAVVQIVIQTARAIARLGDTRSGHLVLGVLLLALAVWMALKSLPAFARSCEIFLVIFAVALLGVLLLSLPRLEAGYCLLFSKQELSAVPGNALSLLGSCSVGLYALFLCGAVRPREGDPGRIYRRVLFFFFALSALFALLVGVFGAPLAGRLERPFFQLVAGLGVEGAFQRLEALYSALWMLGDLALLGLLLFAIKKIGIGLGMQAGKKGMAVLLIACAALGFVGAVVLYGRQEWLLWCLKVLLPAGGLLFLLVLLTLYFVLPALLRRMEIKTSRRAAKKE